MNLAGFGFKPDVKITEVISSRFALSAEVIPPRNGSEQGKILEQIYKLKSAGAQFLSVTRGAGGSLRAGSLPIAQVIKERFEVPCIAHFTCRDLTPEECENQLVDHHYFGIRNILALRGDPPTDQPNWKPKEGSFRYAYQLVEQASRLNRGLFLSRASDSQQRESSSQEKTDFCIGVACYPEGMLPDVAGGSRVSPQQAVEYLKKKVDLGAEYAITQMIFDVDAYSRFRDACFEAGIRIPIIPGTRLLKSQKLARIWSDRFGVSVPLDLVKRLPESTEPGQDSLSQKSNLNDQGIELGFEQVERFKSAGAPGVHWFVLSDTTRVEHVLRALEDRR